MTNILATTSYTDAFFDERKSGSWTSARIVLEELWRFVQPASVIDVGCGEGPWLKMASQLGASLIIGIDGDYIRPDRLWIDHSAFRHCNLETESCRAALGDRDETYFELVMSLEVAEHLSEARGASFVGELCSLGDLILFSAAIPGQGGTTHINEQWPAYWNALFRRHEF